MFGKLLRPHARAPLALSFALAFVGAAPLQRGPPIRVVPTCRAVLGEPVDDGIERASWWLGCYDASQGSASSRAKRSDLGPKPISSSEAPRLA